MLAALSGDRIALAVSGGSDSMAMVHLALAEHPPEKIIVLTVDHGLREGSREEALQVAQWCAELGVEHHTLTWDGAKPRTGIQAKARSARYELMTRWCSQHGLGILCTGHTMDDQAETVAMRKMRTHSAKSLAGIWPETIWNGIRIIRPLLSRRREALRDMLRAKGVSWLEDPSNVNEAFERVRIRKTLIDADVEELARQADAARAHVLDLQSQARIEIQNIASVSEFGCVALQRQALRAMRPDVATEVLSWAIHSASGAEDIEPDSLQAITARVRAYDPFRTTLGGAIIAVRKTEILVGREVGRIPAAPAKVGKEGAILWDDRFWVSAPVGSSLHPAGTRCPRPAKAIPAFVLAALPAVTLPDGRMVLPHFEAQKGVSVTLGERFRL